MIPLVLAVVFTAPLVAHAQGFVAESNPERWGTAVGWAQIPGIVLGQSTKAEADKALSAKGIWKKVDGIEVACYFSSKRPQAILMLKTDEAAKSIVSYEWVTKKAADRKNCASSKIVSELASKQGFLRLGLDVASIKKALGEPQLESDRALSFSFENPQTTGPNLLERLQVDVGLAEGNATRISALYSAESR